MIRLKILGGTRGGKALCRTCRYATYIKGLSENQEILRCSIVEEEMPFEAVECGSYDDKRLPSIHEMRKVAYILRSSYGQPIGFVSAQEWRKKYRKEDTGSDYGDD